jgi:hypothetical protein
MNSWLRGRSLVALLLFGGWSLLVNARERLAPQRTPAASGSVPERAPSDPSPLRGSGAKRDDIVWN